MWLIGFTVVSHIDDVIHHLLVLLLALFEETAYLRQGCFAVLLTGLSLSEVVASLCPINFFWLIGHGTSPRTRHFSSLGYYFANSYEKDCVAQGKSCKGKNLKDLKIFQESINDFAWRRTV